MPRSVDYGLLEKIDKLTLSKLNKEWLKAMKAAPWKIYADREIWTVKSWRETEGEDLQIRRAKLLKCILDNLEIIIHPLMRLSAARRRVLLVARQPLMFAEIIYQA